MSFIFLDVGFEEGEVYGRGQSVGKVFCGILLNGRWRATRFPFSLENAIMIVDQCS